MCVEGRARQSELLCRDLLCEMRGRAISCEMMGRARQGEL